MFCGPVLWQNRLSGRKYQSCAAYLLKAKKENKEKQKREKRKREEKKKKGREEKRRR